VVKTHPIAGRGTDRDHQRSRVMGRKVGGIAMVRILEGETTVRGRGERNLQRKVRKRRGKNQTTTTGGEKKKLH